MTSVKIALYWLVIIGIQLLLGMDSDAWKNVSFRINKLNFIWSKAIHHLNDRTMIGRLQDELNKFDSLYLSAKARSMKNEKLALEEVDNKLVQLLEKYGLESAVNAYMKSESSNQIVAVEQKSSDLLIEQIAEILRLFQKYKWRDDEEENRILPFEKFKDPKLQKLWHAAQKALFSEDALKSLHKELKDHERKLELYEQKTRLFKEFKHNSLNENLFEMSDKLNRELKLYHSDIVDSYDKLHQKVAQVEPKTFNNEKVENLWQLAVQNPNFTTSELESIRVELNHFDKRLEKMKYHDEELKATKKMQEKLGKLNLFEEDISSFEEENQRLQRKLRKLENYLETKIVHTEL